MDENILQKLLLTAVQKNASDLHVVSSSNPSMRINGDLIPIRLNGSNITPDLIDKIVLSSLPPVAKETLEQDFEVDYLYSFNGHRFRANAYKSRGHYEAVFRVIRNTIVNLDSLNIPPAVNDILGNKNGLVLVVGATSSGKSTTMAGMIDRLNIHESYVIITIEDPVEFVHASKKSIISQREVGIDTKTFPKALRSALRQDPDVIVIGEIRDKETASIALESAQTGHLVMATMHATDTADAINRFIKLFPDSEKDITKIMLADTLRGIIGQRLVEDIQKKRVPLVEILVNDLRISDIIRGKDTDGGVLEAIQAGANRGMQTFEDSILTQLQQNRITPEIARKNASNLQSLNIRMRKHGIN